MRTHRSLPSPRSARQCLAAGRLLLALAALAANAAAAPPPAPAGRPGVAPAIVTDPLAVYSVPPIPKPAYLAPITDPIFQSLVTRIANSTGASTSPVAGTWGSDARHVYSKQQPWNADQTLLTIENRSGGSPSPLILDGTTYLPRYGRCANYALYDYRWHPGAAHPHEQINVDPSGTELMWFDVTTCTRTRSWTLPIVVDYGIGSGEGNPSHDGRFVALGNNRDMFVVDMDPQPPHAPYPHRRIGPVYHFPPESLTAGAPDEWTIGNLSISPSGRYVDVKFSSGDATTVDGHRIFEVDPVTLALKPHTMAGGSLRCGTFQSRPNGWIYPLKHADMALNPFDNNEDVIIGGRSCPGSTLPRVVMVRLRDGQLTPLSAGGEASVYHVSARNQDRPGWVYVSFYKVSGARYSDEIVSFKLDGSGAVERWCHVHSSESGCYRCQAHPVPSRDGRRVLFASNWARDCGSGCGSSGDIKDYVVSSPGAFVGVEAAPGAEIGLALEQIHPNPAVSSVAVRYSLPGWAPARIELLDVSGRMVLARDLGSPGPGPHDVRLGAGWNAAPGIYWVRLVQAGRSVTAKVVFMR